MITETVTTVYNPTDPLNTTSISAPPGEVALRLDETGLWHFGRSAEQATEVQINFRRRGCATVRADFRGSEIGTDITVREYVDSCNDADERGPADRRDLFRSEIINVLEEPTSLESVPEQPAPYTYVIQDPLESVALRLDGLDLRHRASSSLRYEIDLAYGCLIAFAYFRSGPAATTIISLRDVVDDCIFDSGHTVTTRRELFEAKVIQRLQN
jgi:hypothetical protein